MIASLQSIHPSMHRHSSSTVSLLHFPRFFTQSNMYLIHLQKAREEEKMKFMECTEEHRKALTKKTKETQDALTSLAQQLTAAKKEIDELKSKLGTTNPLLLEQYSKDKSLLETEKAALQDQLSVLKKVSGEEAQERALFYLYRHVVKRRQALDIQEKAVKAKLEGLDEEKRTLADLRAVEAKLQAELDQARSGQTAETKEEEEDEDDVQDPAAMVEVLNELGEEFEQLQKVKEELQNQLKISTAEKEEAAEEKEQLMNLNQILKDKNQALEQKIENRELQFKIRWQLLSQEQEKVKYIELEKANLLKQLEVTKKELDGFRSSQSEKSQEVDKLKNEKLRLKKSLDEALKNVEEGKKEIGEILKKNQRLQEQNAILSSEKNVLDKRLSSTAAGKDDTVAKEDQFLPVFMQMVTCKVCNLRNKDCIIIKCSHSFCRECIDENLRSRHRKCPGCGIQFSQNDVRPFYFD